jgi:uncharacterized membrane protein
VLRGIHKNFVHHLRFYGAGLFGVSVFAAAHALGGPFSLRLVVAGDAFFAAYLVLAAWAAMGATTHDMRRAASYEDEGVVAILILTFFAVSLCLASIFALLGQQHDPNTLLEARTGPWMVAIAGASVLLAWFTSHTVMAFRYAHLYYSADDESGPGGADARGLDFPGTDEPQIGDFFYYSFVVGMTSQVSDVQACSARMRRATLIHAMSSFLFNTVIVALAVNIAVNGHG